MATKKTKVNIEYAVEYRKGSRWNQRPDALYKYMECKLCGQFSCVGEDATATTCNDCVNEMMPEMKFTRRQKSDKPRGWQCMNCYVHTDGTVYYKGIEQPELKGTLEHTPLQPKQKLNKHQKAMLKARASETLFKLKKQYTNAKSIRERKKINAEINRQSKIAQGKFNKKVIQNFLDSQ